MQKIIGSMIILLACTVMGFEKSKELACHVKELESLKQLFIMIQSELRYSKGTFYEIFATIEKKVEKPLQMWMFDLAKTLIKRDSGTFIYLWQNSIETHFKETFLTTQELEELKQIGKNLSCPESISLYLEQLEISIQRTREEEKNKKKLYQSMGIMAGIFLVIVLV